MENTYFELDSQSEETNCVLRVEGLRIPARVGQLQVINEGPWLQILAKPNQLDPRENIMTRHEEEHAEVMGDLHTGMSFVSSMYFRCLFSSRSGAK